MSWTLYVNFSDKRYMQPHSSYPTEAEAHYYKASYEADGYMVDIVKQNRTINEAMLWLPLKGITV